MKRIYIFNQRARLSLNKVILQIRNMVLARQRYVDDGHQIHKEKKSRLRIFKESVFKLCLLFVSKSIQAELKES
jgi:hypothetical protein